jgi:hypothetical protein
MAAGNFVLLFIKASARNSLHLICSFGIGTELASLIMWLCAFALKGDKGVSFNDHKNVNRVVSSTKDGPKIILVDTGIFVD